MGCSSCFEETSPAIVPVTINRSVVEIDGAPAMHRNDVFSYGDVADNKVFQLSYFPYEATSVMVYRNSQAQIYGVHFTVQNQYVILTTALSDPSDKIFVTYMHVEGVNFTNTAVGSIVSAVGTTLDGFYHMDGASIRSWSECLLLYDWFWKGASVKGNPADTGEPGAARRKALLADGYSGTSFTLKELKDVSYNGDTLVTLSKFISFGGS